MDYSVIIPAFNEEKYLSKTLDILLEVMNKIDYEGEIVIVDNNSSDNTSNIANSYNITLIYERYNQISRARNKGAREAKGDFLIFLDADTLINVLLLRKCLSKLKMAECCGGGTLVKLDQNLNFWQKKILNLWNRISLFFKLAPGCFIFCRKDAFETIGGFPESVYVSEEIWFSIKLKNWGKLHRMPFLILEEDSILSSARKLNNSFPLLAFLILVLFFPFFVFFRSINWLWYKKRE